MAHRQSDCRSSGSRRAVAMTLPNEWRKSSLRNGQSIFGESRGLIAVVDTSPLYAAIARRDPSHARSVEALQSPGFRLVVPAMVVAEVSYLAGSRLGSLAEAG